MLLQFQLHLDLRNPQTPRVRRHQTPGLPILLSQLLITGLLQKTHELLPQPPMHIGRMRRVLQLGCLLLLLGRSLLLRRFRFRCQLLAQLRCACRARLHTTQSDSSTNATAALHARAFFTGVRSGLTGCGGGPMSPLPVRGVMDDVRPWRSSLRAQYGHRISLPVTCTHINTGSGVHVMCAG